MVSLITEHIDIWAAAQTQKINGGRGRRKNSNGQSPHGIKKLRELILELAVRGKLVPQDPNDEPASVLLQRIAKEKARLIKEGKIKKQKPLPKIGEDEKPFELPKNWEWIRLGEIGVWAIGSGFPKKEQGYEGLEILFSKVSDMNIEGNKKYIYTTRNTINEKTASKLKIHVHPEGTVIFPKIGGAIATNKRRIIVKPTAIDNNCLGIKPMTGFDTKYLYLYLSSLDLTEYQVGTSVPALSQGTLELISLGLPPLAEQHSIVAKVDKLMALCDQLEQHQTDSNATHQTLVETLLATLTSAADQGDFTEAWQRIANHFGTLFITEHSIDQLKQTILQLAVMGKLVPQNANDEPAGVLLEKIAKEKARLIKEGKNKKQKPLPEIGEDEKPFELPEGWEWVRLQEAIDVRDGTHDSPKDAIGPDTYPLVTSKNFYNGTIKFDEARRISAEDHFNISKRSFVERYDILFSMIGGNLGNQVMVDDDRPFSVKNVALFKYYDRELTSPFFIRKFMEHLALDLQLKAAGGAQPFVSLGFLRKLVLALPPIAEQHRIVAKVDELMTICDALKARLNNAQTIQIQMADAIVKQAVA